MERMKVNTFGEFSTWLNAVRPSSAYYTNSDYTAISNKSTAYKVEYRLTHIFRTSVIFSAYAPLLDQILPNAKNVNRYSSRNIIKVSFDLSDNVFLSTAYLFQDEANNMIMDFLTKNRVTPIIGGANNLIGVFTEGVE